MPKKTKKEKISAELRRKMSYSHDLKERDKHSQPILQSNNSQSPLYVYKVDSSRSHQQIKQVNNDFTAIRKDIIKTLILASIAISVEVILYLRL